MEERSGHGFAVIFGPFSLGEAEAYVCSHFYSASLHVVVTRARGAGQSPLRRTEKRVFIRDLTPVYEKNPSRQSGE